jgi:hypothetical protein
MRRALVFIALLSCSRTRLHQASPHAVIDATPIDFGATPVLFPVQRSVLVVNQGQVALHVSGIQIDGGPFEVDRAPVEVAAGATLQLKVIFRPPARAAYSGKLSLATDDPDVPSASIALVGTGTESAALTVAPAALQFGRVGEGQTATRDLTLSSTGTADLYLGALGLAPGTPDAFGYVGSVRAPATLPPGAQVKLAVRFSPSPATPSASGALQIDSSDPAHPQLQIPLAGSINRAPIPVARAWLPGGAPQTGAFDAAVGATLQLDATASNDPDGDLPLRFAWSLTARPVGSGAAISAPELPQPTLRLDGPGIYSVELTAIDSTGLPSLVPARLDIRAAPAERLVIELVWDQVPPDLDLHFLQLGAALESAGDCWWANPNPSWAAGTADQNPHHQGDKLTGYGPETVIWKEPAPGTYAISVVYKAEHGAANPVTNAQVRVYAQGVLAAVLTHAMQRAGEVWSAGTVDWPSGRVGVTP